MATSDKLLPASWEELEPAKKTTKVSRPPRTRVKDAKAMHGIYSAMREADKSNAENRALVQGMLDGTPPYDEGERKAAGMDYAANLNFGFGSMLLEQSMANYIDMLSSVEDLAYVRTTFGSINEQVEYNRVIASELTRTIRSWDQFDFQTQLLCHHFLTTGVGHAYFPDPYDFRFRACSQDEFFAPRLTRAIESDMEVAVIVREYAAHELYSKIENPADAKAAGWDEGAVQKAILECSSKNTDYTDWARVAAEMKNNDLSSSIAKQATVKLLHCYVQELDGRVSFYICREDGSDERWLFKRERWFEDPSRAFVIFPYGLGTNAYYHGIRGLAWKVFPLVQEMNKLMSGSLDASKLASALMVQPADENSLEETPLVMVGPCAVLHPNYKLQTRTLPDLNQAVIPVLRDLRSQLFDATGQYTSQSALMNKTERQTRFEVAARLDQAGKLSVTSLNLWYMPWSRVVREMVRRITSPEYAPGMPGYEMVADFMDRVLAAGVPEEAVRSLDHVRTKAVRSVGAGSQAARNNALLELTELASQYDEEGRHNLVRDRTAAITGRDQADRYIPVIPGRRPPQDAKIAELETAAIMSGSPIQVAPNDMHDVHAGIQVPQLVQVADEVDKGARDPVQVFDAFQALWEHCNIHVEQMGTDPRLSPQASAYRKTMQQTGEILYNVAKHLAKLQRQGEGGGAPQPGQAGPDADQQWKDAERQMKVQEFQAKMEAASVKIRGEIQALELARGKAELEATIMVQKAAAERAARDAKTSIDLQRAL